MNNRSSTDWSSTSQVRTCCSTMLKRAFSTSNPGCMWLAWCCIESAARKFISGPPRLAAVHAALSAVHRKSAVASYHHPAKSTMKAMIPNVLTIAGVDPSGGAGIVADVKAISAQQAYACAVVAALTAQNTRAVTGVLAIAAAFVRQQIDTLY